VSPEWQSFAAASWPSLQAGGRVCAPASLPSPAISGFRRPWLTEDHGQAVDWTAPLDDGSRIHVHEYRDGSRIVHRDEVDPSQGPVAALVHCCRETHLGRLVTRVGVIALGVYLGGRAGLWIGSA
jgi:hypothetical protein